MKQQTALQWFIEQLEERGHIIPDHIEETSLIKEKQQIIDAYANAVMKENNSDYIGMHEQSSAEIYFAETYGSNGSETKQ